MRKQSQQAKDRFGIFLSVFMLAIVFAMQLYFIVTDSWEASVSLPLHLCSISKILGAIILVKFNQNIFEFILLMGLGGALQSILTPQLEIPLSTFALLEYYLGHGMIILMPLYLLHVQGHQLRKKSWWTTFFIGLVVLTIVAIINYFIKGNYIYLCTKPVVDNPLLIGPWPYYLSGFLVFGFINIVLFYFIFSWWGKKLKT
jgi:hypothetical integral membrane protein (TIGR02206 family)